MAFCLPTPLAPASVGAPIVTPVVAASNVAAPISLTPVAPAVIPLPCNPV